jgi:hypothetical protein
VNAKVRFWVHDTWKNVVSLGVDGFFRRETAEIDCDRSDLFPFDPDTRGYDVRWNNQLSVVDH